MTFGEWLGKEAAESFMMPPRRTARRKTISTSAPNWREKAREAMGDLPPSHHHAVRYGRKLVRGPQENGSHGKED